MLIGYSEGGAVISTFKRRTFAGFLCDFFPPVFRLFRRLPFLLLSHCLPRSYRLPHLQILLLLSVRFSLHLFTREKTVSHIPFHFQDFICSSPYCLPYYSSDVGLKLVSLVKS